MYVTGYVSIKTWWWIGTLFLMKDIIREIFDRFVVWYSLEAKVNLRPPYIQWQQKYQYDFLCLFGMPRLSENQAVLKHSP